MILKFIAPILLFLIGIIQGIFPAKINEKKWLKVTLIGLLLVSLIYGIFNIKINDDNAAKISREQKNDIDSLKIQNSLLSSKLDGLHKAISLNMKDRSIQENEMNKKVNELNEKLEPFVKIALTKYPAYDLQSALNKLAKDIESTKKLAAPPILVPSGEKVSRGNKGITLLLQFKSTKNQSLGLIKFYANIINSTAKILDFWPSLKGGAFSSGPDSKKISSDGKTARLIYSLIGAGNPTFKLTVSKATYVKITGNYLHKPVILRIE